MKFPWVDDENVGGHYYTLNTLSDLLIAAQTNRSRAILPHSHIPLSRQQLSQVKVAVDTYPHPILITGALERWKKARKAARPRSKESLTTLVPVPDPSTGKRYPIAFDIVVNGTHRDARHLAKLLKEHALPGVNANVARAIHALTSGAGVVVSLRDNKRFAMRNEAKQLATREAQAKRERAGWLRIRESPPAPASGKDCAALSFLEIPKSVWGTYDLESIIASLGACLYKGNMWSELSNPHTESNLLLVALSGNSVVAAALCVRRRAYLEVMYLCSSKACRGAGTAVMRFAERVAGRFGGRHVVLTSSDNAEEFYDKIGYRRTAANNLPRKFSHYKNVLAIKKKACDGGVSDRRAPRKRLNCICLTWRTSTR